MSRPRWPPRTRLDWRDNGGPRQGDRVGVRFRFQEDVIGFQRFAVAAVLPEPAASAGVPGGSAASMLPPPFPQSRRHHPESPPEGLPRCQPPRCLHGNIASVGLAKDQRSCSGDAKVLKSVRGGRRKRKESGRIRERMTKGTWLNPSFAVRRFFRLVVFLLFSLLLILRDSSDHGLCHPPEKLPRGRKCHGDGQGQSEVGTALPPGRLRRGRRPGRRCATCFAMSRVCISREFLIVWSNTTPVVLGEHEKLKPNAAEESKHAKQ